MNTPEKKCGTCEHWMKSSQCPREMGGQKPSASSWPCNHFLLEWTTASKLQPPAIPPRRFPSSPIIQWSDAYDANGEGCLVHPGSCPNNNPVKIISWWDGRKYSGYVIPPTKFNAIHLYAYDIASAKEIMEQNARQWYAFQLEKHRTELANAMYCLGLDHPLSIHPKL